jgi:hypothetical protein
MKVLGYPSEALFEIGVSENLLASTQEEFKLKNEFDMKFPHIAADHAVLKAVALMIERNNVLVSEQLRKLGLLDDWE